MLAGSDGRTYWVAVVRDTPEAEGLPRLMGGGPPATRPAPQTVVRARAIGSAESQWKRLALLSQPAAALTNRSGALAVLLADGQWLTVFDGGSGRFPVPGEDSGADVGKLVAIAQAGEALYGIVESPRPSTPPATRATTGPAAGRLSLWAYQDSAWSKAGDLPPSLMSSADADLTLAAAGDDLYLAARAGRTVRLLHWSADRPATREASTTPVTRPATRPVVAGRWASLGEVSADPKLPFDWLGNDPPAPPTLWVAGAKSPGELWPLQFASGPAGIRLSKSVTLPAGKGAPAGPPVAAVNAGNTLRVLYASDGNLFEQSFRPDGAAEVRAAKELAAPAAGPSPVSQLFNFLILGLLVLVTVAGFRRQPVPQEVIDRLHAPLAPLGLRAAAGLIDLAPFLVAVAAVAARHPEASGGSLMFGRLDEGILYAGTLAYVAHTLAGEWWTGRTVGKYLLRLRVARINGEPVNGPTALVRNLMRMVDVALAFIPLLWVFVNPLRQRFGDLVSGTVVVLNATPAPVGPTEEAVREMEKADEPAAVE